MPRIELVDPTTTTGPTRDILDRVTRGIGRVPNALRVLATSPVALEAWWSFERALDRSSLSPALREQLAVLTAATNRCDYCLGAHTAAARAHGVSPDDADGARVGTAADPFAAAVLRFARAALAVHGGVDDEAIEAARAAGIGDVQLIEILAVLAINGFSNAYNRLAEPPLDHPAVALPAEPGREIIVDR